MDAVPGTMNALDRDADLSRAPLLRPALLDLIFAQKSSAYNAAKQGWHVEPDTASVLVIQR